MRRSGRRGQGLVEAPTGGRRRLRQERRLRLRDSPGLSIGGRTDGLRSSYAAVAVATRAAASWRVTLRPEVEVGPGRFEDWVCDGFWFGTLMERERRGHAHAGPGGSSRLTSLTNTSSKPGPYSSGCSLTSAITFR